MVYGIIHHNQKGALSMTEQNIKHHVSFIKGMNAYDVKSFIKCAHRGHIYYTIDALNVVFEAQKKKFK